MKTEKPSGVSAWVMRARQIINVVVLTLLFGVVSVSTSGMTHVAQCIPMNDRFVGPLRPLVRQIIGGIGGLIPLVVSTLLIIAIAVGLFKVFRNEEISGIIKGFIALLLIPLAGIAVLILINAVLDVFNNMCSKTYF